MPPEHAALEDAPSPLLAWLPPDRGEGPPPEPLPPRRVRVRVRSGLWACDLGTPGLVGVAPTLAAHALLSAVALPLGVVGLAASTWHDFPMAIRVGGGVAGLLTALGVAAVTVWPLVFAGGWRERVARVGDRVVVEQGVWPFRRARDLGPAAPLRVAVARREETLLGALRVPNALCPWAGWRVFLRGEGDAAVALGVWLDEAMARRLARELGAICAAPSDGEGELAGVGDLGWTPARVAHALGRHVDELRARPAELLFDLGVALGLALVTARPEVRSLAPAAYPLFGLAAFVAFGVLAGDRRRVIGLVSVDGRSLALPFAAAALSLLAVLGLAAGPLATRALYGSEPSLDPGPLAAGLATACAVGAWSLGRAARSARGHALAPPGPLAGRLASAALLVGLLGMTFVHEGWARAAILDARRELGPISLALVPVVVALLVWPPRLFLLLADPWRDGPRWRFVWLVLGLSALALTGWRAP